MMKRNRKDRRYTLVEMIMVITIILILVTIGILVAPLVTRQASEAKTKALMGMIENALEEYKGSDLSGGNYPMCHETCYSPLFVCGQQPPTPQTVKGTLLQFFEFEQIYDQLAFFDGEGFGIADGFGQTFLYKAPGYRMSGGYDLASCGANLLPGLSEVKDMKDKNSYGTEQRKAYDALIKSGELTIENSIEFELGKGDDIANFMTK